MDIRRGVVCGRGNAPGGQLAVGVAMIMCPMRADCDAHTLMGLEAPARLPSAQVDKNQYR